MTMRLWIGNLAQYNDGVLRGDWIDFPVKEEELEEFLEEKVGIGEHDEFGNEYEEWHVCDYETDLGIKVDRYEDIFALNELIWEIELLKDWELKACLAFMEADTDDWKFAMECIKSGRYLHLSHIDNYYDLGEYWFVESGYRNEMPEHLIQFFDFEKYGEYCGEHGCMTSYGYFEAY